jgi:hypothetical protein
MAALDVPAAKTAATAKILNFVGIATSAKHAKERQSAATEVVNTAQSNRVPRAPEPLSYMPKYGILPR